MNIPTDQTYKNIDNVNRFLGDIWYLIGYVSEHSDLEESLALIDEGVLQPLIERSDEFCENLYERLYLSDKLLGVGGYGYVSYLLVEENQRMRRVYAVNVSLKQSGGFNANWIPVVVKVSKRGYLFSLDLTQYNEKLWLEWNDPLQEIFVGGLSSYLFDTGINPHATKYFGAYFCHEDTESYQEAQELLYSNIILEESTFDMFQLLDRTKGILTEITSQDIINLLFQYLYAVYTFKHYFGYVNFDAHLGNLMVSYVRMDKISLPYSKVPFMYHGRDLEQVDYLVYKLILTDKPIDVWVENTGLILKLIDFGLTVIDLSQVVHPFQYNFGIKSSDEDYRQIEKAEDAWLTYLAYPETGNSVDINFTLVNLWSYLKIGFDRIKHSKRHPRDFGQYQHLHDRLIQELDEILHFLVPSLDGLYSKYREDQAVFRDKDVGTEGQSQTSFLERMVEYLQHQGQSDDTRCWITRDGKPPVNDNFIAINPLKPAKFSEIERFFKRTNEFYAQDCDEYQTVSCRDLRVAITKADPNSVTESSLLDNVVENGEITPTKDYRIWKSGQAQIYTFNIYAGQHPQVDLDLKYHGYQRLFDFHATPEKMVGKVYPNTIIHMIKVNNRGKKRPEIYLSLGKEDLYTIADFFLDGHQGFSVNGGFFIVEPNIKNPLMKLPDKYQKEYPEYRSITMRDFNYPIGYYYNVDTPETRGTRLPVPKPYRQYFVMVKIKDNRITLEKYLDFMNRHQTKKLPVVYNLYDEQKKQFKMTDGEPDKYVVLQKVIDLVNNEPQVDIRDYDYVFTTGPILIWDHQLVFTEKMLAEKFQIEVPESQSLQEYRLAINSYSTTNLFYTGDGDRNFLYGQRSSANIYILNVLAEFDNGDIAFFLVEGRGFGAVGMDRIQIAKLIASQFPEVKHAVGLDGGFSANCVYGTKGDLRYLLPDPDKRPLGTVMTFITS